MRINEITGEEIVEKPCTDSRIVDVAIPFWSMTILLFKVALAMIPAAILLALTGAAVLGFLNGIGGI